MDKIEQKINNDSSQLNKRILDIKTQNEDLNKTINKLNTN